VKGPTIEAIVRAELERVKGCAPLTVNRLYLKRETGLSWNQLESAIAKCAADMLAEESTIAKAQR
jgi:hypothetical protein